MLKTSISSFEFTPNVTIYDNDDSSIRNFRPVICYKGKKASKYIHQK